MPAVLRACEHLGVTAQVVIHQVNYDRPGSAQGRHRRVRGVHHVSVARWLAPAKASRVLWHELTHVAQYQRDGRMADTARVLKEQGYDAYFAHPAEVEARASERNHDWLPLAR